MDLIIHAGLPKAGSTTLQENILSSVPGYLGIVQSKKLEDDLGKQFAHLVPRDYNYVVNDKEIELWVSAVRKLKESRWPTTNRLILSNEDLTNRAIAPFLQYLSNNHWASGQVKALMIVRNQSEWLCSNYIQLSNRNSEASQQHFEKQVRHLLNTDYTDYEIENSGYVDKKRSHVLGFSSYYIDWARRVEKLYEALGPDNVCVLLLEEMKTKKFWDELSDFMQVDNLVGGDLTTNLSQENVRRTKKNVWNIRPWNGKSDTFKAIESTWPPDLFPVSRRLVLGMNRRVSLFLNRKRDTEIHLTDEIREKIREHCKPYNERLSELIGKDLDKMGY